jgi:hypothetical protein
MINHIRRALLCSVVAIAMTHATTRDGRAWSGDVFDQYLSSGKWSEKADDNASGEALPFAIVKETVKRYCQAPKDKDALENMGILALTLGAANWGVNDLKDIPPDPNKKKWASTTGDDAGKHLMSYAIGGVGISHADVGDLREFLELQAGKETHADRKARLNALVNDVRYGKDRNKTVKTSKDVVYDELRAAGVCNSAHDTDLDGIPFEHRKQSANSKYCKARANDQLNRDDWQLFRTVTRNALRQKSEQEWLLRLWMRDYWEKSLKKVHSGPGYIEEVMVNARIRNSSPRTANEAIAPKGSLPDERIKKELAAYGADDAERLERRRGVMMRPVVLYRFVAASLKTEGISCGN